MTTKFTWNNANAYLVYLKQIQANELPLNTKGTYYRDVDARQREALDRIIDAIPVMLKVKYGEIDVNSPEVMAASSDIKDANAIMKALKSSK